MDESSPHPPTEPKWSPYGCCHLWYLCSQMAFSFHWHFYCSASYFNGIHQPPLPHPASPGKSSWKARDFSGNHAFEAIYTHNESYRGAWEPKPRRQDLGEDWMLFLKFSENQNDCAFCMSVTQIKKVRCGSITLHFKSTWSCLLVICLYNYLCLSKNTKIGDLVL